MKLKTLGPWKKSYDKPAAVLNYSVVVWLFVIPRTVACQALLSMGILQSRILEWVAIPSPPGDLLNPGIKPRCPCWQILYHLRHQGNPRTTEWVAYPFSRASSWPRNQTRVSCIAGRFFTHWDTNLDSILKSRDITLLTKFYLVKLCFFHRVGP